MYHRQKTHLALLSTALFGVCTIFWADTMKETTFWILIRDLGIALIVSAFVTFAVELNASARLRLEVAVDVLQAAYQHVVPPVIWSQVTASILRSDVICRDWQLDIEVRSPESDTIAKKFEQLGTGIHLVHYVADRIIENINERPINYDVFGTLDADLCLPEQTIPRFTSLDVTWPGNPSNDIHIGDSEESKRAFVQIQTDLLSNENTTWKGTFDRITFTHDQNVELKFATSYRIPAYETVRIRYEAWRGIRAPGLFVYTVGVPADSLTIRMFGPDDFEFNVLALHPDAEQIEHPTARYWRLNKGLLPGQGVQIGFARKPRRGEAKPDQTLEADA